MPPPTCSSSFPTSESLSSTTRSAACIDPHKPNPFHPAYTGRSTDHCMIPETLVLVDGKQRLTACLLFLDDKVPVFGCTFSQYSDSRMILGPSGPRLHMEVNNLQTRKEILTW